ncbi:MAG: glycine cleavage T C-terminal barrel domain-containing protein [Pirellulaceae bacterium]
MTLAPEILEQYTALTVACGLADLSGAGLVEVTGADRVQLLHGFTTNDVKKLPALRGCEAFVTSPQGKTVGHLLIVQRGDSLLLVSTPGQAAGLIAHFDKYVISEDVKLTDRTEQLNLFLLAGPSAGLALRSVIGSEPPADSLAFANATMGDATLLIGRIDSLGVPAFLILADRVDAPRLQAAMGQAGAIPCGSAVLELVRLEAGLPLFGQDFGDDNLPQEIGRDAQAISFTKGCYLGQETIARIDALGHVNRLLTGVKFTAAELPPLGTKLLVEGKEVGQLTSIAWSPKLAAPLGLALVRRAQSTPGKCLTSSDAAGEVVRLPLSTDLAGAEKSA